MGDWAWCTPLNTIARSVRSFKQLRCPFVGAHPAGDWAWYAPLNTIAHRVRSYKEPRRLF